MVDKYKNFSELKKARPSSFEINHNTQTDSFLIFTPHGGGIEPGTTEICEWFNKHSYSYYSFTGIGSKCNDLHITSTKFDEPSLLEILKQHRHAISIHGMNDYMRKTYMADIFLGGLDSIFIDSLEKKLQILGFSVVTFKKYPNSPLAALNPDNLTNKCLSGRGIQIELSQSLRETFFKGDFTSKMGRAKTTKIFDIFCNIIREVITEQYD